MTGEQVAFLEDSKEHAHETTGQEYLRGLNSPQREAVEHFRGPIVVLAGAGSGKTRVLTHRIAHLISAHRVRPSSILAVTFTNKATEEMKHRLGGLLQEGAREVWVSTFHSAALRILRHNAPRLKYTNDFVVYDDQDSKSLIKSILKESNIDEQKYPPDLFARAIDTAKNSYKFPDDVAKAAHNVDTQLKAEVYDKYQKRLLAQNAMDFGDLLINTVRIFKEYPDVLDYYRRTLDFVLVDEFQDTNKVQYMFIRLISEPKKNLFVVGDDDQSIYAFRGATIRNILEFERDYPEAKVVKLEQNYRSTSTILEAAHAVIEKNKERKAKKLWTSSGSGDPIRTFIGYDENSEADFIASEIAKRFHQGTKYQDMAILYRTNAQTRALEEAFLRFKIPYRIFGGLKFYDRKEIKDILAYLRLLVNPADDQSFQRVINTPPRGIGAQTLQAVFDEARMTGTSLMQASLAIATKSRPIAAFLELLAELKKASETKLLSELIAFTIERTEYGPKLKAMKDPTAQSRIENLIELEGIGRSIEVPGEPTLQVLRSFLDRVTLTSSADAAANESKQVKNGERPDAVSLMTLHLAKGLEFPVVFLSGLEEGLLPHYRSIDDPTAIEEERRLCYVGITRAMRSLYLTRAYNRGMFAAGGSIGSSGGVRTVSRFARDISSEMFQPIGEERSPGGNFISGFPLMDDVDNDDAGSGYGGRYSRSSYKRGDEYQERSGGGRAASMSLDEIRNLLAPADALQKKGNVQQAAPHPDYVGLPLAAPEDLAEGVEVYHSSFGAGVIEGREGPADNPKVTVKFAGFSEPKKLVYSFAKLAKKA